MTERRDHLTRFKKGQVANPGGRPKLPAELKILRTAQRSAFFKLVITMLNLTPEELDRRRSGPDITNYESILGGLINKAGEGDVGAAKFVLELAIGKLEESSEPDPEELRILILVKQYIERIERDRATETDRDSQPEITHES